jgi:hypothetical protein
VGLGTKLEISTVYVMGELGNWPPKNLRLGNWQIGPFFKKLRNLASKLNFLRKLVFRHFWVLTVLTLGYKDHFTPKEKKIKNRVLFIYCIFCVCVYIY